MLTYMIEQVKEEVKILNRHLQILRRIVDEEPVGIVTLSKETGYPRHKVRYSMRVLQEEGLVEPTRRGATTTDDAQEYLADLEQELDELRQAIESARPIRVNAAD